MLTSLLPALAAALDGAGPALLPLPTGGSRGDVLAAMDLTRPLERDDVALVVPTSGSTGEPKGAMLTAAALRHSARATHDRLGGDGQWLLALPVTHVAGLTVLVRSLVARTRPEVVDLYGGFDVAAFVAATGAAGGRACGTTRRSCPTQLRRLLDAGDDAVGSLRTYDAVLVGGAALSPGLHDRAVAAGVRVVTTYGMSETCGGCVYDGWPLDGVEVRLRDDGRIELGGPTVFAGYRLRPDLTAAALVDGRHVTQDIGRLGRRRAAGGAQPGRRRGRLRRRERADRPGRAGARRPPRRGRRRGGRRARRRVGAAGGGRRAGRPSRRRRRRSRSCGRTPPTRLAPAAFPRELVVLGLLPLLPSGKLDKNAVRSLVAARH